MVRRLSVLLAVVVLAALVSPVAASGQESPPPKRPGVTPVVDLDPGPVPWVSDLDLSVPDPAPDLELGKPGWTVASGSVAVDPGAASKAVPNVPVQVVADSRLVGDSRTVGIEVLDASVAGQLSLLDAALAFDVSSVKSADAVWDGLEFEVDYGDVPVIGGADVLGRLELTQYSGCQLDESVKEPVLKCATSRVVDATNDLENRVFAFSLEDVKVEVAEDTRRLASGAVVAIPAESMTVLAMTTGVASDYGSFAVAPVASVLDYQVGLFTGAASLSYPIPVPAAEAGPTPSVVLSYSSAAVDGMHPDVNNQGGLIGLGWSYHPGAVTRAFGACDNGEHQCVGEDGDLTDDYTLQLNGVASALVYDATEDEYHLKNDPYWKMERHYADPVLNDDADGEYWTVTTTDGTVYSFGRQIEPTSGADQRSVLYTQVTDYPGCSNCQLAYQWNLDRIEDTNGNVVSFFYEYELNEYGNPAVEYVRSAYLARIEYGKQAGSENQAPNTRVLFNTEWRCGADYQNGAFSDCNDFPDTPLDLRFDYSESAPTFFTERRLGSIQTQTLNPASGEYVTAGFFDLHQFFPDNGEGEERLWLQRIYDRGVGNYSFSAFEQLEAETYTQRSSVWTTDTIGDYGGGRAVKWNEPGDWFRFANVDFAGDTAKLLLRVSSDGGGTIELATSETGAAFATITVPDTLGFNTYQTIEVTNPSTPIGIADLYVRFTAGTGHVNWLRFVPTDLTPYNGSTTHTVHYPANEAAWLNNRAYILDSEDNLWHPAGLPAPRIGAIKNEINGEITFAYDRPVPCDGLNHPLDVADGDTYDNNERHCYPAATPDASVPWTITNKWVVESVSIKHPQAGVGDENDPIVTSYTYGTPRWAKTISPVVGLNQTTWNTFRGHDTVTVTHPDGSQTQHWFYQGMNHDYAFGCGATSCPERSPESVSIPTWLSGAGLSPSPLLDEYWMVGREYASEHRTGSSASTWLSHGFVEYSATGTITAGSGDRDAARFIAPNATQSESRPTTTSVSLESRTEFVYDSVGNTVGVRDKGDDVNSSVDDTYLQRELYPNPGSGTWITDRVKEERLWDGTSPGQEGAELSVNTYLYDGQITDTDPIVDGNLAEARSWVQYTPTEQTSATTFSYDSRGRLASILDPELSETTFGYHSTAGWLQTTTNDLGWITTYGVDRFRRVTSVTDHNNRATVAELDTWGRVVNVTPPGAGSETATYSYNDSADPVSVETGTRIDNGNWVYSAVYVDGFGRTIQTDSPSPNAGERMVTRTIFDDMGRVTRDTDPYLTSGAIASGVDSIAWLDVDASRWFYYDDAGNLDYQRHIVNYTEPWRVETDTAAVSGVSVIDAAGDAETCDCIQATVSERFDPSGASQTDTVSFHDRDGLLRRVDEYMDGALYATTMYGYDQLGRLRTVHDGAKDDNGQPDPNITTIDYDMLGRKTSMTDPDMGTWEYGYDDAGNLTSQWDAIAVENQTGPTTFTYDSLHRLTRRDNPDGAYARWVYDDAAAAPNTGLLDYSETDSASAPVVRNYYDQYDAGGRLEVQRLYVTGDFGGTFKTQWDYDDAGILQSVQYPADNNNTLGEVVEYGYNTLGQPVSLADSSGDTYVSDTTYELWGAITSQTYGAGSNLVKTFTYDNQRRLAAITAPTAGFSLTYDDYDLNNNIQSITDGNDQKQCFTYDDLDRLTGAFTTGHSYACTATPVAEGPAPYELTFDYDEIGNIVTRSDLGTYVYEAEQVAGGAPHAVTEIGGGAYSFGYDDNGNMTSRYTPDSTQTLDFDQDHQLESVTETGLVTEFAYDADGRRVLKTVDDGNNITGTVYVAGIYEHETLLIPDPELSAHPESMSGEGTYGETSFVLLGNVTVYAPGELSIPISMTTKGSWMTILVGGGGISTPANIAILGNPSGLSADTYNGWIDVTATGYQDLRIPVSFTVNASGLKATPDDVQLAGTAGSDEQTTTVTLATTADPAATYTLTSDHPSWLTAGPTPGSAGTGGTAITIAADPETLTAGTYEGTITATAAGYTTETIDVTFAVAEPPSPIVEVQQKATTSSYSGDSVSVTLDSTPTPGNLVVVVAASGADGVTTGPSGFGAPVYAAGRAGYYDTRAVWAKVAEAGDPTQLTVQFANNEEHGLAVFEYSGINNPAFDVGADQSSDYTDVTALTTGTTSTTTSTDEIAIAIWNRWGDATTATSYSNNFVEQVDLNYNGSGGFHVATKTLTSTGTVESTMSGFPDSWTHSMVVTFGTGQPTTPWLETDLSTISLAAPEDGSPVDGTVAVTASDGAQVLFDVSENAAWLTAAPTSGTTGVDSVTLTANPTGLTAGTHQTTVTMTAVGYDPVDVDVTFNVTTPGTAVINQTQASSGAGSADGFTASPTTTPTVGNLLVIGVTGGDVVTLDTAETAWTEAVTSGGEVTIYYKIAEGNTTADDAGFDLPSANQYAWIYTEYEATNGWATNPLDVTGSYPLTSTADDELPSGTTATPTDDGLGVAVFRLRNGDPVDNLAFTNGYGFVNSDGTQWGQPWSIEAIMSANTTTDQSAQSTVASWTLNDNRGGRGAAIAVFIPVGGAPTLQATPTSVTLAADDGGITVDSDVTITASDSATVTFNATTNASWLTVTPTGTTPDDITVTANPTGEQPGTYNGTVTVTAAGYNPADIPVTFTINPVQTAITQVQMADGSANYTTSVSATLPSAPTVGNHLIAVVTSGASTVDTPAGWTPAGTDYQGAAKGIYWKNATSSDTTVTFTFGGTSEEHSLVVFEYTGLADPPPDQFGAAHDTTGSNSTLTVAASSANSQAVELNVVGAMSWNPDTDITWGTGYTEHVDEFNGGYMNYGAATKITSSIETASTTITVGSNMQLFGVVASFKAAQGAPSLEANPTSVSLTAEETSGGSGTVTVVRSGGASGSDTMTLDIGTAGTDRVVAVYLDVESSGTDATGVTIDGKSATLVAVADNPNSVGNHSELWYIDEDQLGTSNGTVTIAAQGTTSLWGIQAVLITGADQTGHADYGIDNTSVGTDTITPAAIDIPAGGVVVMGGGEGSQNRTVTSITSPLVVLESHDPSSADMFLAAGIETTTQTDKAYVMTLSSAHNRASGVVASWAPAPNSATVSETVTITTSDNNNATYTATSNQTWLNAEPDSGDTGTSGVDIDIEADPSGLAVGTHNGIVTLTAAGYNPVDVPVTLIITAAPSTDVTLVQSAANAGSASTFEAWLDTTPIQGNLLVIGTSAGSAITLDSGETTWTKADSTTDDRVAVWYKIAQGNDTDYDVWFDLPSANQYAWSMAEYTTPSGWGINPLDVGAHNSESGDDDQISTGTTPTPAAAGLGVAMFRLRDGAGPVADLTFTNDYTLVNRDGTQYGNAWSLEGILADNTTTTTNPQTTTAAWTTNDYRDSRGGVIVTFTPDSQQQATAPTETTDATLGGLFDRRGGNTALQGNLLIAQPDTVNATTAAAMYQTSGLTIVTETWYYTISGRTVAMRRAIDDVDQGVEFLITDHLGSTSAAYNPATSETARQYHNPWGQLRGATDPTVDTDIGYTGQRLDTSTNLMYYNARYYDPAIGRFISADTIVPDVGNPPDLNRYTYVRNNPTGYVDPTGHSIDHPDDCGDGETWSGGLCNQSLAGIALVGLTGMGIPEYREVFVNYFMQLADQTEYFEIWSHLHGDDQFVIDFLGLYGLADETKRRAILEGASVEFLLAYQTIDGYAYGSCDSAFCLWGSAALIVLPSLGPALRSARLGPADDIAGSIRNVNPTGSGTNCVNCVMAVDATLSGYPASALPSGGKAISVLERLFGGRFSAVAGRTEIEAMLKNAGDGARGVVFGSRGPGQIGHVYVGVNQGGAIRFLDGQAGGAAVFSSQYTSYSFMLYTP